MSKWEYHITEAVGLTSDANEAIQRAVKDGWELVNGSTSIKQTPSGFGSGFINEKVYTFFWRRATDD